MNYSKYFRHAIFAVIAVLTIVFSPLGNNNASASEVETEADFTSTELKEAAKQYIGVPYVYGGTTSKGFDCSGFVRKVFGELDISLPRTSASMYNVGDSVKESELIPGDLVFFNTTGRGISHVGIYYGDGKFIHSQNGDGVSVTDLNDKYYWGARYVGAKRVAEVQLVAAN